MHCKAPRELRLGLTVALGFFLVSASAESSEVQTTNFRIRARSMDVAKQVAQYAERHRKNKAIEWLGFELPPWRTPCTVDVKISHGGAGGATHFDFSDSGDIGQEMTVEGSLERILNSVLPHEITHTIFAAKFKRPLPRWADEGGAVLSEDQEEISRHDLMVREFINAGRMIPLSRLFVLDEYPNDVMVLYAQGFSVANYLVSQQGRQQYLDFVAYGQLVGWDRAVQRYYGVRSVPELERNWINWLIAGKGTGADGPPVIAQRPQRQPASPKLVVRGQSPDDPPTQGVASRGAAGVDRRRSTAAASPSPRVVIADSKANAARQPTRAIPPAAGARITGVESVKQYVKPRDDAEKPTPTVQAAPAPRRLIPIPLGRTQ